MERWLQEQITEQKRLEALPDEKRTVFKGKYWYAVGVFGAELLGAHQNTSADALQVFNDFLKARQANIDRAITAEKAASGWNTCEHKWRERVDSQSHSDIQIDVVCVKCGCPGAQDARTGTVTWPAT